MSKIFAIMSGKGGVGKSTVSSALAELYARQGLKVTLVDGDVGLRCADLMLGMQDRVVYDLGDWAQSDCTPEQALSPVPGLPTLTLLAAPQMLRPSDMKSKQIEQVVSWLEKRQDVVLIDAPAGIGRGLKNLLLEQARPVIVATPDDVAIRDAERLTALLQERGLDAHPGLVLNRVSRRLVRWGEMLPPRQIAAALDLPLMGLIPESDGIYRALLRHETALHAGDEAVSRAMEALGSRLLGANTPLPDYRPSPLLRFFSKGGDRI